MAKGRRSNGGGSITKKEDKSGNILYYARVSLSDGRRVGKYFPKEKEAQKWLTEQLGNLQKGSFVEPEKTLLKEWLDKWMNDYMKISKKPTTFDSYKTTIDCHIIPELGNIPLQKLQTSNLQKLYNDKLTSGRKDKKEGGLSPRTIHYMHMIIHSCLGQAVREKLIMLNPADNCILPKDEKKEMKYLDDAGIKAFLDTARNNRYYKRYYTAYLLLLSTGLRRGELLGCSSPL
jgi:integrase